MKTQVALVTGAGSGIGRAIALRLADDGIHLLINDLPSQGGAESLAANQVVDEIRSNGGQAMALPADVSQRDQVDQMMRTALDRYDRLDYAVANAAWNVKRKIVDTDWSSIQRIVDVTLFGTLHLAQLAARQMMTQPLLAEGQSRGKILFIGSIHAEMAVPFHGVYAMAKAGVNQLCRSLASEMLPHRINVNAINPGWIDTPGERAYLSESELSAAGQDLPWGRLGRPDEIAGLAAFLLSHAADYMTGEAVSMDGGLRIDPSNILPESSE